MENKTERKRSEYHTKRFPHTVCIRLNDEQFEKVKGDTSGIIRKLLKDYEAVQQPQGTDSGDAQEQGVSQASEAVEASA